MTDLERLREKLSHDTWARVILDAHLKEDEQVLAELSAVKKAHTKAEAELDRLRDDANEEIQAAHDERDRLREEIAERQVNLDGWADRAEEAEAELARLHEDKRKLQDYWKEEQDHRIEAEDERDRLREELEDLQLMLDDCEARNALSIEGEAGR